MGFNSGFKGLIPARHTFSQHLENWDRGVETRSQHKCQHFCFCRSYTYNLEMVRYPATRNRMN